MNRVLAMSLILLAVGCAPKVSSVHGWDGPETSVLVDRSGAEITLLCPTGGWIVTIDEAKQDGDTAQVYLSARKPTGIVTQAITPVRVHWKAEQAPSPACVQALIRIDQGEWVPAAQGCR